MGIFLLLDSIPGGENSHRCKYEGVVWLCGFGPEAQTLGSELRLPAAEHRRNRFSFRQYHPEVCCDLSYSYWTSYSYYMSSTKLNPDCISNDTFYAATMIDTHKAGSRTIYQDIEDG
jgi:hypothetical protein